MPCPFELRTNELSLRSVVRLLRFERQVVVVVRLRNGANTFDDRLPMIASILAVKNIAIGGAGENRIAAVPDVHRHAFDIGADVLGQPAGQHFPSFAAVPAARDAGIGGVKIPPRAGSGFGTRNKQNIRILRVNEERVHVADAEIPRRHALPGCTAIAADTKACGGFRTTVRRRRGAVNLAGIIAWNQHPVRVGIYIVDRRPGLPTIRAA
jgi:hypothetical protein